MSQKKTITLPKSQVHFIKDRGYRVTDVARHALEQNICSEQTTLPKRGTRHRPGEKHRTTINLDDRHAKFLVENDIDFSRLIREAIGEWMRKERSLIQKENNPGDVRQAADRAIIDLVSQAGLTQETGFDPPHEWIRWYQTGVHPQEAFVRAERRILETSRIPGRRVE